MTDLNVLIINASPQRKGVISTLLEEFESVIGDANQARTELL